jgi:heme A synthase
VIIRRGAAAIPFMVGPLALAGVLVGLVMADDAACACPEQPVMTGIMPGDSAYDGTLQAALGRRRSGAQRDACDR